MLEGYADEEAAAAAVATEMAESLGRFRMAAGRRCTIENESLWVSDRMVLGLLYCIQNTSRGV